jgi:hypothetical protein
MDWSDAVLRHRPNWITHAWDDRDFADHFPDVRARSLFGPEYRYSSWGRHGAALYNLEGALQSCSRLTDDMVMAALRTSFYGVRNVWTPARAMAPHGGRPLALHAAVREDVLVASYLVWPVNMNSHWFMLVHDRTRAIVYVFDTVRGGGTRVNSTRDWYGRWLQRQGLPPVPATDWNSAPVQDQQSPTSCGILAVENARQFLLEHGANTTFGGWMTSPLLRPHLPAPAQGRFPSRRDAEEAIVSMWI